MLLIGSRRFYGIFLSRCLDNLIRNVHMSLYVYNENEPIYIQISETLLNDIRTNYEPGDFLPSEFALAERFGVNRHTVRRAVDELIRDGVLGRYRGRGTAVLELPIDFPIHRDSRFYGHINKTRTHTCQSGP